VSVIRDAVIRVVEGQSLSAEEAQSVLAEILDGTATDAQIGGLLVGLKVRGETHEEITGFAKTLRQRAIKVTVGQDGLVDTAGTGGDKTKTFNVSTAAALVLAAGGLRVAKHGNRSVSSRSGSADLMEAFGVRLEVDPQTVARCIEHAGIGFMYAPAFHPTLKRVAPIRRELGARTIFNMLGPLINPAGVRRQLLGVAEPTMVEVMARALSDLGTDYGCVVHGLEGMDEVSVCSPTLMAIVQDHTISHVTLTPKELGVEGVNPSQLVCQGVDDSALTVYRIVSGMTGAGDPKTMLVAANAAVGFMVGGTAQTVSEGLELALRTLESGGAADRLRHLVTLSGGDASKLERIERLAQLSK
jgi:anthranilate phosphoribosyltransferase